MIPPEQRPTARELASGGARMEIAGKPADVCPYCGCGMFANGTQQGENVVFRYVNCRNRNCGKRFYSKQPAATLLREITGEPSSSGNIALTLHREPA